MADTTSYTPILTYRGIEIFKVKTGCYRVESMYVTSIRIAIKCIDVYLKSI